MYIILANSSDDVENTIWIQILVIIVLATLWGVYTYVKNKPENIKDNKQDFEDTSFDYSSSSTQHQRPHRNFSQRKGKYSAEIRDIHIRSTDVHKSTYVPLDNASIAGRQKTKNKSMKRRMRDTSSGMELIELDSLLDIVHNTKGKDENDVMMRKLAFNELLRRGNQEHIFSAALAIYAVNKDKIYGKDIQCAAIKELTQRTAQYTHS